MQVHITEMDYSFHFMVIISNPCKSAIFNGEVLKIFRLIENVTSISYDGTLRLVLGLNNPNWWGSLTGYNNYSPISSSTESIHRVYWTSLAWGSVIWPDKRSLLAAALILKLVWAIWRTFWSQGVVVFLSQPNSTVYLGDIDVD